MVSFPGALLCLQIAELQAERLQAEAAAQESMQAQDAAIAAVEATEEHIASLHARLAEEQTKTAAAQAALAQASLAWQALVLLPGHLMST